jgi:hypothetical protein
MDIEYDINIDDIVSFDVYNHNNSPKLIKNRKINKVGSIVIGVILLINGSVLVVLKEILGVVGIALALVFLYVGFFSENGALKNIISQATRHYYMYGNQIIGKHLASITPDSISDTHHTGQLTLKWSDIAKIITTNNHIYFVIGNDQQSYTVPRKAFADDASFNQFAETAKQYHQAALVKAKTA